MSDGQYEFLRMSFGLCNSPSVFQKYINAIFKNLIQNGIVLVYMDDLIVFSDDNKSGLKNLEDVFNTASQARLIINWSKCCFLKKTVEFLGHTIGGGRVQPSERKTEAVRHFPEPKTIRQIQAFLGLTGYFRKFIPKYAAVARPLSDLLRANVKFRFEAAETDAFIQLKTFLSERPVLSLYRTGAKQSCTRMHRCMVGEQFFYSAIAKINYCIPFTTQVVKRRARKKNIPVMSWKFLPLSKQSSDSVCI